MKSTIFFRNDDVRDALDDSLIRLTNIFVSRGIPISHAVEPANVSDEVVNWLLSLKKQYPKLIEIIQHGYNHKVNFAINKNGKTRKGEFGGKRDFDVEYRDLMLGMELMNDKFANYWCPIITFPFGSFNSNTIKAADQLGYIGLSSSVSYKGKSNAKNLIGKAFFRETVFGKNVSYHNSTRIGSSLYELDVSVNIIKKYINDNKAVHFSQNEILKNIMETNGKTQYIGVLLHHRYHKNIVEEIDTVLGKIQNLEFKFSTLERIINGKEKK